MYNTKQNQYFSGFGYFINGTKFGLWQELHDNYNNKSQIIQTGFYDDGKKYSKWLIKFREQCYQDFQTIGGGYYDVDQKKTGCWKEIYDNFSIKSQLFFYGNYHENLKIGKWTIKYNQYKGDQFQLQSIGGGLYNGIGKKNGFWIEPHCNFYQFCEILHRGNYIQGEKIGLWEIIMDSQIIGFGLYQKGCKNLQWVDVDENFNILQQILYIGVYNLNYKVGLWKTIIRNDLDKEFLMQNITNITYQIEQKAAIIKNALKLVFGKSCVPVLKILQQGEYSNGRKVGFWQYIKSKNSFYKQIGGGMYDNEGKKQGSWIELHEKFSHRHQYIKSGFYNDGQKIGKFVFQALQI